MPKEFYKILEVDQNSTQDEIKQSYKRLAKIHHPDKGGDKEVFQKEFEMILHSITDRLEIVANEGLISGIKSVFSYLRDKITQAVKWISDRIFTISGLAIMGLAGILFVISQWGSGLGIPQEFANVTINAVLVLGITTFTYGQKNDEYKQISEI